MGNLFYNVLGGSAGSPIATTHNANYSLFSNVQSEGSITKYWSATESDATSAWEFSMEDGAQSGSTRTFGFYAWAVQSGDVVSIPEPSTFLLFSVGLIGIFLKKLTFFGSGDSG